MGEKNTGDLIALWDFFMFPINIINVKFDPIN